MNKVRSKPLATYLATCVDRWREHDPEVTCMDILSALEIIRFKLTEAMIRSDAKKN